MYRSFIVLFLLLALAACVPQTADGSPQTAVPPTPEHRPLNTATATPTETPVPQPEHPAAFDDAFARGLIHFDAARGEWLVTAIQTVDGGRETVELALLPDTFSTNDALRAHNPLAPYTVRALDENGQELTLLWNPDTAEFRLAYTFPTIVEGIDTDNPRLIEENLDKVPFIPIEDIQNGLAAQSVLLAMQEGGYQPFSENTRLGENRLHFELRNNGLRVADLISLENFNRNLNVNNHPMKVTPFFFKTQLPNGQEVMVSWISILNPANHDNWSPDEFIVVPGILPFGNIQEQVSNQDLANFFRATHPFYAINRFFLYATNPNLDPNDPNTIIIPNPNNPDSPTLLDARDPFQSLLAQLLSIPGNDVRDLTTVEDGVFYFPSNMTYIDDLGTEQYGNTIEVPMHTRLTSKIQTMGPFLFEVGVAP